MIFKYRFILYAIFIKKKNYMFSTISNFLQELTFPIRKPQNQSSLFESIFTEEKKDMMYTSDYENNMSHLFRY